MFSSTLNKIKFGSFKSVIFIIAIFTIVIINLYHGFQFQKFLLSNTWIVHSHQVIHATEKVLRQITLAETQAQAYGKTKNPVYLNKMNEHIQLTNGALLLLQALTNDDPKQAALIKNFATIVRNSLNTLSNTKNNNDVNAVTSQVNKAGDSIIKIESDLLRTRNAALTDTISTTTKFRAIGETGGIILLLLSLLLFISELKRSVEAEKKIKNVEHQLRSIISNASDMIAVLGADYRYQLFNAAYEKEFRTIFNKKIKVGDSLEDIFASDKKQGEKVIATFRDSFVLGDYIKNISFNTNGQEYCLEVASSLIKDENNNSLAAIHIIRNITERMKEQEELKQSYAQLSLAMKNLQDRNEKTSLLLEMSDVMLACGSVAELSKVMGTYCGRALGFTSGIIYIMPPSKDRLEEGAAWGELRNQKTNFTVDQCWALRMGHIHYVDGLHTKLFCEHVNMNKGVDINYLCVPLRAQNDIYGLLYVEIMPQSGKSFLTDTERLLVTTFAEVAAISLANVRLRENLRNQSMCDPLTGLYNRRYLSEFLIKQIHQSERTNKPISIMMLDLDHFKKINDVYGHDAGDIVLKEFSESINSGIRPGDVAARYGGEEFVIVLYDTAGVDAKNRAETIRKSLPMMKIRYAGQEIGPLSVSIGVSVYPTDSKNGQDLIELADKALYSAKNTGRNKVVLYSKIEEVELVEEET